MEIGHGTSRRIGIRCNQVCASIDSGSGRKISRRNIKIMDQKKAIELLQGLLDAAVVKGLFNNAQGVIMLQKAIDYCKENLPAMPH